jgi:hypothetical protein
LRGQPQSRSKTRGFIAAMRRKIVRHPLKRLDEMHFPPAPLLHAEGVTTPVCVRKNSMALRGRLDFL